MSLLFLGYGVAAAAFYFVIAKTAKLEPELMVVSNGAHQPAVLLDLAERFEKRAA